MYECVLKIYEVRIHTVCRGTGAGKHYYSHHNITVDTHPYMHSCLLYSCP